MRSILFILFIVLGVGVFAYWNYKNDLENERKEAELIEEISKEELKESLERVVRGQSIPVPLKENAINNVQVKAYEWKLAEKLPAEGPMRKSTLELLNLLKSIEEQNTYIDMNKRKETRAALEEFNKNPESAQQIFNYLLNSEEIQASDSMQASLLKLSSYTSFDKGSIIEFAEQVMTSTNINPSATNIDELGSKDQILKIKEASNIIMTQISNNKEEAVEYVRNAMTNHQHPILKEEFLTQLAAHYPKEAEELRNQEIKNEQETLEQYLMREND